MSGPMAAISVKPVPWSTMPGPMWMMVMYSMPANMLVMLALAPAALPRTFQLLMSSSLSTEQPWNIESKFTHLLVFQLPVPVTVASLVAL